MAKEFDALKKAVQSLKDASKVDPKTIERMKAAQKAAQDLSKKS